MGFYQTDVPRTVSSSVDGNHIGFLCRAVRQTSSPQHFSGSLRGARPARSPVRERLEIPERTTEIEWEDDIQNTRALQSGNRVLTYY